MTYEEKIAALTETAKEDGVDRDEGRRIFATLCFYATDYQDAANVTPTRILMQALGYTKYRISKELSILKKLGLVERTTCGFPAYEIYTENGLTDFDESHPPINGFGLTTKGFESATYKKAIKFLDEEYRRLAEMTEEEIQREMKQECGNERDIIQSQA
jgi:hypothetical protein